MAKVSSQNLAGESLRERVLAQSRKTPGGGVLTRLIQPFWAYPTRGFVKEKSLRTKGLRPKERVSEKVPDGIPEKNL